ncbi:MAG: caspase family protein [Chloroflexota bacterium]
MSDVPYFTHGYALLIGVGADLPITVEDATGLRDILVDPQRCAYPPQHVKLLTEADANRQTILDSLDWLAGQTGNDSEATAIVYFSGHGGYMPHYHLVLHGYDPHDLTHTAISGNEFTKKLRAIEAKKLVILLDCCHAGGMTEITKSMGFVKSPAPPELDAVLTAGSGRVMIASSRKNELSYTGTPYSVFTQALREGLAGYGAADKDGYAYIADIALYVGKVVPQRTNDKQNPILKFSQADNFAVAYYAGGAKSPKPLESVSPSLDTRILAILYKHYQKHPGSPKLKLDKLVQDCQAKRDDVIRALYRLKEIGWVEYSFLDQAEGGMVWLTHEGIEVAIQLV